MRPANVLTHRNELKPFTVNNLWNNPGYKINFKDIEELKKDQEEDLDQVKVKPQEEVTKDIGLDLVEVYL